MLSRNQFSVLSSIALTGVSAQRSLVKRTGMSLGSVNAAISQLRGLSLIDEEGATSAGWAALAPFKVDNAVIMAAGLSSRFAPISYERPKGVLKVAGEVLVERQIKQLQEAGIDDITLVVGYMKEEFFYLEDAMGVKIVVNPDYAQRNNNSTIKCVSMILGNTYICSSDDYFEENPFESYVYSSYYAAVFEEGPTEEYCLRTHGKDKTIVGVDVGGEDSWVMLGHAYWNREYSSRFVQILNNIYDEPATAQKLWEDIYIDHLKELPPMVMRCYPSGAIWEFDSLDELRMFDPEFIDNVDSSILENICAVLGCVRRDIQDIIPIKKGLTNLSFKFSARGCDYVYRHPGVGTAEIIDRASEAFSQGVAKDLGIDDTFIYEDPDNGWKISCYVPGCTTFDYHNPDHVKGAMAIARRLHGCGISSAWNFDIYQAAVKQIEFLDKRHRATFKDFRELSEMVGKLDALVKADGTQPCLCHNDMYAPNFLVKDSKLTLIDWEYSGMSDYASDLGVFVCCCPDYSYDDAIGVFETYFGRKLTEAELFHCVAYTAIVSFYWFVWALYKDSCGDSVGEWLYLWYRYAKTYGERAFALRGPGCSPGVA